MNPQDTSLAVSALRKESRNVFRLSNICTFVYIVINLLLIWSVLSALTFTGESFCWSVLLYAVSLLVALSPVGEFFLRLQTGCRSLKKRPKSAAILQPLFEEVYVKAREQLPNVPKNLRLYINDDSSPNAFATGRRTICATRGLLTLPPDQIKAILGHEFGHIAHRDTYLLQGILVGNFLVTVLVTAVRLAAVVMTSVAHVAAICTPGDSLGVGKSLEVMMTGLAHVMVMIGFNLFMWVWSQLGILLVMKTSRENEYEADRFSANCGYRQELIDAFKFLDAASGNQHSGLFAMLSSSHPDFDSRIARLEEVA